MCDRGEILYHSTSVCTVTGTLSPKYILELDLCASQSSPLERTLVLVKDAFNVFLQPKLKYGHKLDVNLSIYCLSHPMPHGY